MPQITGPQTGTPANDTFIGSLEALDLTADTDETGILDATITAQSGADRIESVVSLAPGVGDLTLNATGIANSTIRAGAGDDTVIGTASAERFFEGFSIRGPRYSGRGDRTGLRSSTVFGGAGNDTLTFTAEDQNVQAGVFSDTQTRYWHWRFGFHGGRG